MAFGKKKKQAAFSVGRLDDIRPQKGGDILSLKKEHYTIRISKEFLHKIFGKEGSYLGTIAVVLLLLFITGFSFSSRANVAYYYPTSCLGGWEKVANAEGEPSLDEHASASDFTLQNSALNSDGTSSLFCGGFDGTLPDNTTATSYVLSFSMSVDNGSVDHSIKKPKKTIDTLLESNTDEPVTDEPVGDEEEADTSGEVSGDEAEDTETVDEGANDAPGNSGDTSQKESATTKETPADEKKGDEPAPAPEPTPEPASDGAAFFFQPRIAFAEGEETAPADPLPEEPTPPEPEVVVEEEATDSSDVTPEEVGGEEVPTEETASEEEVTDEESTTDETGDTSSKKDKKEKAKEVVKEVKDPILAIRYTLDGSTWNEVGKISLYDWQNAYFDIPLMDIVDLADIQIEVVPVQTIDAAPVIYIDAFKIAVSYENTEDIEVLPADFAIDEIDNDNDMFTLQSEAGTFSPLRLHARTDGGAVHGLAVYNLDTGEIILSTYTEESEYILDPTYLKSGHFVAIRTNDTDMCNGLTYEECKDSPNFVSASRFRIVDKNAPPEEDTTTDTTTDTTVTDTSTDIMDALSEMNLGEVNTNPGGDTEDVPVEETMPSDESDTSSDTSSDTTNETTSEESSGGSDTPSSDGGDTGGDTSAGADTSGGDSGV